MFVFVSWQAERTITKYFGVEHTINDARRYSSLCPSIKLVSNVILNGLQLRRLQVPAVVCHITRKAESERHMLDSCCSR